MNNSNFRLTVSLNGADSSLLETFSFRVEKVTFSHTKMIVVYNEDSNASGHKLIEEFNKYGLTKPTVSTITRGVNPPVGNIKFHLVTYKDAFGEDILYEDDADNMFLTNVSSELDKSGHSELQYTMVFMNVDALGMQSLFG